MLRSYEISKEVVIIYKEDDGLNWGSGSKDGEICVRRYIGRV